MTKGRLAIAIVIAILIVDQAIKLWVKTNMALHESIQVTNWFYIAFIENNGMAYGMELGSKLALSLFRICAISALGYYVWLLCRRETRKSYVVVLSLILAGAIGNLIDCMFYGLIFEASNSYTVAGFVPFGEGYSSFLEGKVVDMFYFPLIVTTYPDWFPVYGGQEFIFFSPVFNFADSAISVGVVLLLLFFRKEISEISLSSDKHADKGESEKDSDKQTAKAV